MNFFVHGSLPIGPDFFSRNPQFPKVDQKNEMKKFLESMKFRIIIIFYLFFTVVIERNENLLLTYLYPRVANVVADHDDLLTQ